MSVEIRVKKGEKWVSLDPPKGGFKISYEVVNNFFDFKGFGRSNTLEIKVPFTPKNSLYFEFSNIIEIKRKINTSDAPAILLWNGVRLKQGLIKISDEISQDFISVYLLFDNSVFDFKISNTVIPSQAMIFSNNTTELTNMYLDFASNTGGSHYYQSLAQGFCFPYMQSVYDLPNMQNNNINYTTYRSTGGNDAYIMCHFVSNALRQMFSQYFPDGSNVIHGDFYEDPETRDLILINDQYYSDINNQPPSVPVSTFYKINFKSFLLNLRKLLCIDYSFLSPTSYSTMQRNYNPNYTEVAVPVDYHTSTFRVDFIKSKLKNRDKVDLTPFFTPKYKIKELKFDEDLIQNDFVKSVLLDSEPHANEFKGPKMSPRMYNISEIAPPDIKYSFFRGLQPADITGAALNFPMCSHDNLDINDNVIGNYTLEKEGQYGLKENFWKDYILLHTDNIEVTRYAWLGIKELITIDGLMKNNDILIIDRIEYFIVEFKGSLKTQDKCLFTFKLIKNNL